MKKIFVVPIHLRWKRKGIETMIITDVKATPLIVPYKEPYYWAQGVIDGAGVLLVEIKTDSGLIGYGESISTPSPEGVHAFIKARTPCGDGVEILSPYPIKPESVLISTSNTPAPCITPCAQ